MRKKKIAIVNFGAHGHVNPTLELSRALVRNGHTVDYLITQHFEPLIRATGARVFPYHPTHQQVTPNSDVDNSRAAPDIRQVASSKPATGQMVEDALARRNVALRAIDILPAVIAYCEAEKPDILLFEKLCWASVVCARRFGIPSAMLHATYCGSEWAPGLNPIFETPSDPAEFADLERALEKHLDMYPEAPKSLQQVYDDHETCNIVFMSKQFHPAGNKFDERYHFVGSQIPLASERRPDGKLLYASLGTIFGMNRAWFYRDCIDAFANTDWKVVMALGAFHSPSSFEPLPSNIELTQYVDQRDVLRRASVFITHGGMTSVQDAIWLGVPMIVVPQGFDQYASAKRISELRCGVSMAESQQTLAAVLRNAVAGVAENGDIQQNLRMQRRYSEESGGIVGATTLVESLLH